MEYKPDHNVLVPVGYGGETTIPKRRFVVESKTLKKGKYSDNYKVLLIPHGQINASELWVVTKI